MNVEKNRRVGVLMGGLSKEREVSLRTGKAMAQALGRLGYADVVEIDVGHDVADRLKNERIDVAVIALHGRYGEDGTIQGILEFLRIPYTGTGVLGSAVAMDKGMTKRVLDSAGVKTPPWLEAGAETGMNLLKKEVARVIGFPVVAKPSNEGSSLGLTVVSGEEGVEEAQRKGLRFDRSVLWEKFVRGTELTVSFVGNRPLPPIEIVAKKGLYDYEAKYTRGMTEYFCPARVSLEVVRIAQEEAVKAFRALKCDSWGRVDTIFENGTAWVLEVNTVPGMTETSLVPKAWQAGGGTFESLMEEILSGASLKTQAAEGNG